MVKNIIYFYRKTGHQCINLIINLLNCFAPLTCTSATNIATTYIVTTHETNTCLATTYIAVTHIANILTAITIDLILMTLFNDGVFQLSYTEYQYSRICLIYMYPYTRLLSHVYHIRIFISLHCLYLVFLLIYCICNFLFSFLYSWFVDILYFKFVVC